MTDSRAVVTIFVAILLFLPAETQGQDRYAAFVHGFTFGDDRPGGDEHYMEVLEDKGERWEKSGTIEQWKRENVIDGHIILKYFDRDLYGGSRDKTVDQNHSEMMGRFVAEMKEVAPNDGRWVLVGHSQGGIVVRLLHEYIRANVPDMNVEGVISVASPMQGAKPTTMSYGYRSGYTDVKPVINGLLKDLLKGPLGEAVSNLLKFIVPEVGIAFDIVANVWDPITYVADGVISILEPKLERKLNSMAVDKDSKSAIGPDGELIRKINRAPNPDAYRAYLGAERVPVGPRVGSGAFLEPEQVAFAPLAQFGIRMTGSFFGVGLGELSRIFTKDRTLLPGDEPTAVNFFYEVKDAYRDAADYYRYSCYTLLTCLTGDYRKFKRWKQGRRAIENFEATYTEIMNAYTLERRWDTRLVCYSVESDLEEDAYMSFNPPSADEYVHGYIMEEECWEEMYYYYVTVPDKTDGLLGIATTSWDKPMKGMAPRLSSQSILYGDEQSSHRYARGGTGYNHAEMVYSRRRYSSSEDPGVSNTAFSKGQPNPPMQDNGNWISEVFEANKQ